MSGVKGLNQCGAAFIYLHSRMIRTILLLFFPVLFTSLNAQTQVGIDIDGEAAVDRSGSSVSLSSDGLRVAIGATGNDGNGSNAGHVRIYEEVNGNWVQVGSDIDGEASLDESGWSVSLSSDCIFHSP